MPKPLCESCRHGHRFDDVRGRTTVICHAHRSMQIREVVVTCNLYQHKDESDKYDLEQIAYILKVDKKGKIGFDPPKRNDD